jgi:hypothetical protein
MSKTYLKILTVIILLVAVIILPLLYPAGIAVYFRLFLLMVILVESIKLFKMVVIDRPIKRNVSNFATVLFSFFVIILLLESIFMFVPRSHNFDFTLGSKLWFDKYWTPINSSGFRDKEPSNNHRIILFVGDSYTAGHGLKSVEDRFSNIVGNHLNKNNKDYAAINIGKLSADTLGEYNLMKNFLYNTRIKPEVIILQYFGNDIDYVAAENGLIFQGFYTYSDVHKFFIPAIAGSYLLNYIYWSFPREYLGISYRIFLNQAYKNDGIMSKHKDELKLFVDYAKANSIRLIVVVCPFLTNLEMSDSMYANDVINYFKMNKVETINVSELVKDIPVSDRIINKNDQHPSKTVNLVVAKEILKIL